MEKGNVFLVHQKHGCNVMFSTSLQSFFFFQKGGKKRVYSTLEQNCFFLHYLLFGVSLTCLSFLFLAIFTQEYSPSENNFNAVSGKNKSTTGKPFLIKAFY